LGKAA